MQGAEVPGTTHEGVSSAEVVRHEDDKVRPRMTKNAGVQAEQIETKDFIGLYLHRQPAARCRSTAQRG